MPDAGIDGVAVGLVVRPDRRVHVGPARVDAGVVLRVDAESLRTNARNRYGVGARPVAHDERPERRVVRGIAEALAAAPAEADDPHPVGPGRLETLHVRHGRVEVLRDRVGGERRDELAGVVRRRRRPTVMRQQIGSDRHEAVLGELLRGLADEVRHPEDLVDHHDGGCRILALGIGEVGRDGVAAAGELDVLGVDVGAVEGGRGRWRALEVGQSEQHSR